jgi:hypothetical protein
MVKHDKEEIGKILNACSDVYRELLDMYGGEGRAWARALVEPIQKSFKAYSDCSGKLDALSQKKTKEAHPKPQAAGKDAPKDAPKGTLDPVMSQRKQLIEQMGNEFKNLVEMLNKPHEEVDKLIATTAAVNAVSTLGSTVVKNMARKIADLKKAKQRVDPHRIAELLADKLADQVATAQDLLAATHKERLYPITEDEISALLKESVTSSQDYKDLVVKATA